MAAGPAAGPTWGVSDMPPGAEGQALDPKMAAVIHKQQAGDPGHPRQRTRGQRAAASCLRLPLLSCWDDVNSEI